MLELAGESQLIAIVVINPEFTVAPGEVINLLRKCKTQGLVVKIQLVNIADIDKEPSW